LLEEITYIN